MKTIDSGLEQENSNAEANTDVNAESYPAWLDNFIDIYSQLSVDNLALLVNVYHDDVAFIDPIHSLQGYEQLKQYFDNIYTNLSSCSFTINQVIHQDSNAAIYWQMTFCHPKLNKGNNVEVCGHSHIQGQGDKVIYHRDYVDVGAMLYEHLPLIGKVIALIKRRASHCD